MLLRFYFEALEGQALIADFLLMGHREKQFSNSNKNKIVQQLQNATNKDNNSRLSITLDTGNDFLSLCNEQILIPVHSSTVIENKDDVVVPDEPDLETSICSFNSMDLDARSIF